MISPPATIQTGPWMLDPEVTYLNHGSFGARPKAVYEAQLRHKRVFEASPVDFLDRKRTDFIDEARQVVAGFLGADVAGFGFVQNATTGVGCVINSLDFEEGDEILTTSLVYNGIRNLLAHAARRSGATYREVHIQFPLHQPDDLVTTILAAISPATKLLVVDHLASTTAVLFPIHEIVSQCKARGIAVLVDGAHAPGMLDLNINDIGADWYVGNLHKWVCAPLGAGFIWTAKDHRSWTHPMSISHFLDQSYIEEYDWQGTRDISPWLSAADAIRWGDEIGWDRIRRHNHVLATWMHTRLVEEWGVEPLTPLDGSMIGNMATVRLPTGFPTELEPCIAMRDNLYQNHRIEVPILAFDGLGAVRVSAQLYSRPEDLESFIAAMREFSLNV